MIRALSVLIVAVAGAAPCLPADWAEKLANPDPSVRVSTVRALANRPNLTADDVLEIAGLLDNKNAGVRGDAFVALQTIGPGAKCATPRLLAVLSDRSVPSADRYGAGCTLATIGSAAVEHLPRVINVLHDRDSYARAGAIEALGGIGSPASGAVPTLFRLAVEDASGGFAWSIHHKATRAMAKIGTHAVPLLVQALRDGNVDEKVTAAATIRKMAEELPKSTRDAIPALIQAINEKDAAVSANAAGALWHTSQNAEEVLPALTRALRERPEPEGLETSKWSPRTAYSARDIAISVLTDMGPSAAPAIPALVESLRTPAFSLEECDLLKALGSMGPSAASAIPDVLPHLWSVQPRVRVAAVSAVRRIAPDAGLPVADIVAQIARDPFDAQGAIEVLGEIDHKSRAAAVPELLKLLKSRDSPVRIKSLEALGQIGPDAAIAMEAVKEVENDSDPRVSLAATQTLRAIERMAERSGPTE